MTKKIRTRAPAPGRIPRPWQERVMKLDKTPDKWLLPAVERACEDARMFAKQFASAADPMRHRRQCERDTRSEIAQQRTAIKRLRWFLEKYPAEAGRALGGAFLIWKERRNGKARFHVEGEKLPPAQILDEFLAAYGEALDNGLYIMRGMLHQYQAGPLLYPRELARQQEKRDAAAAARLGLLFQIVFYFRFASAGRDFIINDGEPMPQCGKSHYSLAAEIVRDAFGDRKDARGGSPRDKVEDLVRKGVALTSWPSDANEKSRS